MAEIFPSEKRYAIRASDSRVTTVFDERDGGTFFGFDGPDGNSWVVQQVRARAEKPLIPRS